MSNFVGGKQWTEKPKEAQPQKWFYLNRMGESSCYYFGAREMLHETNSDFNYVIARDKT